MKKTFFLIGAVVLFNSIAYSRSNQESAEGKAIDPPTSKVSFVNYSKIKLSDLNRKIAEKGMHKENALIDGASVGFEFTLGRKSRNCNGFGICRVEAFWVELYKGQKPKMDSKFTGIILPSDAKAYLVLANNIDDKIYTTILNIDEDINVNNKYIVKKGKYSLDKSIGEYGGYKLDVIKLSK